MSKVKLNLIAAACENMGIGINGTLPWKLKKEMTYFTTMTTKVKDNNKINAVIMGRITWDCIPNKYRPLDNRVNIVLTHHVDDVKAKVPDGVVVVPSLDEAIRYIEGREDIESTWVIGGSAIYKAAMEHENCGKIYLTEIQKSFNCDTFFPNIDKQQFHLVDEEEIPGERQLEGDISYFFRVYKKIPHIASCKLDCECGLIIARIRSLYLLKGTIQPLDTFYGGIVTRQLLLLHGWTGSNWGITTTTEYQRKVEALLLRFAWLVHVAGGTDVLKVNPDVELTYYKVCEDYSYLYLTTRTKLIAKNRRKKL